MFYESWPACGGGEAATFFLTVRARLEVPFSFGASDRPRLAVAPPPFLSSGSEPLGELDAN